MNYVLFNYFIVEAVTAATDAATVTDQLLIVITEEPSLYSALFYLFIKLTVA